jgi:acetyl esterase/lipase
MKSGGGWSMPANSGHFEFAAAIVRNADINGKSISFAFVQYGLAPEAQYPSQLSQCVEVLDYTLKTLGKQPSKVMLAGDSAGGNLVMGVISHLLHPHPDIKPVELTSPLKAAIIFSPWVNLEMNSASVLENRMQDPVSPEVMRSWAREYMGKAPLDYYNQPSIAPSAWWRGMPVGQLLITGAAREMLADDLTRFSETMKVELSRAVGLIGLLILFIRRCIHQQLYSSRPTIFTRNL